MGNSSRSKLCKKYQFQECVDDVDSSVTNLAYSLDITWSTARKMILHTFQGCDENSKLADAFEDGKQLLHQYIEAQKQLINSRDTALQDIQKLLHILQRILKRKSDRSIGQNENNLQLDKYINEPKPKLAVINVIEESDWDKLSSKVRRYEHELDRYREKTESLCSQLKVSSDEKKKLEATIQAKTKENKDVQSRSDSFEKELQSLKIEVTSLREKEVNRQYSAHQTHSVSDRKEKEPVDKLENEDGMRHGSSNVNDAILRRKYVARSEENMYLRNDEKERLKREKEMFVKQITDIKQEIKVKDLKIEKLIKHLEKRENDISHFQHELTCVTDQNEKLRKQEKESHAETLQLRKETVSLKASFQTEGIKNKDLMLKINTLENEILSLRDKLQNTRKTNVITNDVEQLEYLERENKRLRKENQDLQIEKTRINADILRFKEHAEKCPGNELLRQNERLEREKEFLEKERTVLEHEVETKNCKIVELNKDIEANRSSFRTESEVSQSIKKERDALRQDNENVRQQLDEREREFVNYKKALEVRIVNMQLESRRGEVELRNQQGKKLNEALKKNSQLNMNIEELQKLLENKNSENAELNLQVTFLSQQKKKHETEQIVQKKADEKRNGQIKRLEGLLMEASHEKELMKERNNKTTEANKIEIEKLLKEIKDLKGNSCLLENQLKSVTKKNIDLQIALETYKKSNDATMKELTHNIEKLQERNAETENALVSLGLDKRELQQMYELVRRELDQLKSTKIMRIQLYHHSRVSLVSKVQHELKALLKKEMEDDSTKLDFVECGGGNDIDPNEPLFILCISASRLGTDATNAIQSLKLTSKMALLVFHHKDGHALPNQASEHVLTGQVFKHIGGIYDFGFLSSKGIYSCEMNDQNIKHIIRFLNKEGTRCVRDV